MGSVMLLTVGVLAVLAEFVLNDFNVSFWTGLIAGCLIGVGYEQLVASRKGEDHEVPPGDAGHHETERARLPHTEQKDQAPHDDGCREGLRTEESQYDDEGLPVRECPVCGEAMVRDVWTGYGLGDLYKWHCRDCGTLMAGGETADSELHPYPFE